MHEQACECLTCKLAYWRDNGAPGVHFAGGRETFHNEPSLKAREKQAVAENTAKHGKDGFSRADS